MIEKIYDLILHNFDHLSLLPRCIKELSFSELAGSSYCDSTPDKRFFLYANNNAMRIVDGQNPTNITTIVDLNINPTFITFNNKAHICYKKFNDNLVIWDVLQHKIAYEIPKPHGYATVRYLPSKSGNYIVAYDETSRSVCLYDLLAQTTKEITVNADILAVIWLSDTNILALLTEQKLILISSPDG